MRIKDGFVLREVGGQAMVIATGAASRDFHGMIKLNGTGKTVWQGLAAGKSTDEITAEIAEACGVDKAIVKADVEALVSQMRDAGFLAE